MFTKKEIIERDYKACLDFIDKIDGQLFKIRHWSFVSITAVIAYSYHKEVGLISLYGIFISLFFMYLELVYKLLQDDITEKAREIDECIEKVLSGEKDESVWNDYKVGMGRALKKPSIIRILKSTYNSHKWHIITIYATGIIASFSSYISLNGIPW